MKVDNQKLNEHKIESTSGTKKMRLSENAQSRVFQLFTKSVYSNPIGTVVREITSNCFDSHVEAGVDSPVLIKKSYDEETQSYYISFIDYGVGMSPDRVENVYSVYFESTKSDNNDEIGGFGIGGKTPLAYKRNTGEGEAEYDNSFFVITNFDGQKYYYTVYEGNDTPEFTKFHQEDTDERNGTEIRIPVLSKDLSKFDSEMLRQLFYFENVVFEGFDEGSVANDYQIIKGKSFLYRDENLDSSMHVCLGKVYYPIDYNVLGLSSHDYRIPVAINVPIGAINVTVSRESLDYSEQTISYLKKRLEEVKIELKGMLEKQYENIKTLEDYFQVKQNFGILYLTDNKSLTLSNMLSKNEIDYSKYRFSAFETPSSSALFKLFFNATCYGKRELKGWSRNDFEQMEKNYDGLSKSSNLYHVDGEYSRKRVKQAYLRSEHGRFYVITQKDLSMQYYKVMETFENMHFDTMDDYLASKTYKLIMKMQKEYFAIVQNKTKNYMAVEVPEDYKVEYATPRISNEVKNTTIPMKIHGNYSKQRIKVSELVNFKGVIFYGSTDEEGKCSYAYSIFCELFESENVATSYSSWRDEKWGKKKGVMFITLAKNNLKYTQYLRKAYPIDQFYTRMAWRKAESVKKAIRTEAIKRRWYDVNEFYTTEFFTEVSPNWGGKVEKVKNFIEVMSDERTDVTRYKAYFEQFIDFDKNELTGEEKLIEKHLDSIMKMQEKNKLALNYIRTPNGHWVVDKETDSKIVKKILKSVMSL